MCILKWFKNGLFWILKTFRHYQRRLCVKRCSLEQKYNTDFDLMYSCVMYSNCQIPWIFKRYAVSFSKVEGWIEFWQCEWQYLIKIRIISWFVVVIHVKIYQEVGSQNIYFDKVFGFHTHVFCHNSNIMVTILIVIFNAD